MADRLTPEEVKREWVEAAERSEWLLGVRKRVDWAYLEEPEPVLAARLDAEKLLYYVDTLRSYIQEKNELIKAFAGPTGMTPEDVAYLRERAQGLRAVVWELLELEAHVDFGIPPPGWSQLIQHAREAVNFG